MKQRAWNVHQIKPISCVAQISADIIFYLQFIMSLDFETHLFLISIPKSKIIPSAAEKYSSQLFVPSFT